MKSVQFKTSVLLVKKIQLFKLMYTHNDGSTLYKKISREGQLTQIRMYEIRRETNPQAFIESCNSVTSLCQI